MQPRPLSSPRLDVIPNLSLSSRAKTREARSLRPGCLCGARRTREPAPSEAEGDRSVECNLARFLRLGLMSSRIFLCHPERRHAKRVLCAPDAFAGRVAPESLPRAKPRGIAALNATSPAFFA